MDWCGNNRRELVDMIEIPNTQVNILKINALKIKANIIGKKSISLLYFNETYGTV